MDPGMQGLDPPIHDLGKAGMGRDLRHREPGFGEGAGRAAGGEQRHALADEKAGEIHQPGLVGNGDQRAGDGEDRSSHRVSRRLGPVRASGSRAPDGRAPGAAGRGRSPRTAACSAIEGGLEGRPVRRAGIDAQQAGARRRGWAAPPRDRGRSCSFSPGRLPVKTILTSTSGCLPARRIIWRARSTMRTGSPMSSMKTAPGWGWRRANAAAWSTSSTASRVVMK